MAFRGALSQSSPFQKLLFAVGMMLFSSILFTLISFLLIKSLYGINILLDSYALTDLENPVSLKSMKLFQALAGGLGMFIVPALLSAYFFDGNGSGYLGVNKKPVFTSAFLVLALAFVSMPIINWMVEVNSNLSLPSAFSSLEQWMKNAEENAERITEAFLKVNSVLGLGVNICIVALLPALGEELFFRGILQRIFSGMLKNAHIAIWLTAIIFSAIHLQFYGFLPRMMLGVFLGYLYYWSGNLWLPVIAHFINNAGAVLLSYLFQKGAIGFDPETVGTGPNETVMLLISIALTFGLLYIFKRAEKSQVASF